MCLSFPNALTVSQPVDDRKILSTPPIGTILSLWVISGHVSRLVVIIVYLSERAVQLVRAHAHLGRFLAYFREHLQARVIVGGRNDSHPQPQHEYDAEQGPVRDGHREDRVHDERVEDAQATCDFTILRFYAILRDYDFMILRDFTSFITQLRISYA